MASVLTSFQLELGLYCTFEQMKIDVRGEVHTREIDGTVCSRKIANVPKIETDLRNLHMFPFPFPLQDTFCLTWFCTAPFFVTSTVFSLLLFHLYFAKGEEYDTLSSNNIPFETRLERNKDVYFEIKQTLISSCRSHTGQFLPPGINSIIFEYLPPPNDTFEVTYWESLIDDETTKTHRNIFFWQILFTAYYLLQFVYYLFITIYI